VICIYCKEDQPESAYTKAEHVLPQSFGRFEDNLTLNEVVCDHCNQYFGDELELYLARDTPDGLNRFRYGLKDAQDYKSLGKRSTLTFRIDSGPLAGAHAIQRVVEGEFLVMPLPQLGFGASQDGPFRWFLLDALPTREELKELFEEGLDRVEFCEVDHSEALEALKALGAQTSDFVETREGNWRGRGKIEARTTLSHGFGRVITKISLNYLASQYGAQTALMPQFDVARRYARHADLPPARIWDADTEKIIKNAPNVFGHVLTVAWQPESKTVLAQVSFHNWNRYQVCLAVDGFVLDQPFKACGHFFDLSAMRVVPLDPAW